MKILLKFLFLFFFLAFIQVIAQERISQLIDSLAAEKVETHKLEFQLNIAKELMYSDKIRMNHYLNLAKKSAETIKTDESWKKYYAETYKIYADLDELDLALESLLKEYDFYENTKDLKKYEIENQLGIINSRLNNPEKAIQFFTKILSFYQSEKIYDLAAKTYNNIGLSYFSMEKKDSALHNYSKGLEIIKKKPDSKIEFHLIINLGKCYSSLNEFEKAKNLFEQATNLVESDFPPSIVSWLNLEKSIHYFSSGNYDKSLEFAQIAEKLEPNKNSFQYSKILRILYKTFNEKGDFKSAAFYFTKYDELWENLNIEEKAVNVEKLKIDYEYKIKEQETALENNRKRMNFLATIGGLTIVLLLTLILVIRYKNRLIKIKLENELKEYREKELQQVLELKNKELATKTIKETEQNELFNRLQKDLKDIQSKTQQSDTRQALNQLLRKLKSNATQNNWEEFELRFSHVYESFYAKLNDLHPHLSSNDKRICALIKLNLSTKEISHITKLSAKSIENTRTRLRKKLGLTNSKIELAKYLEGLK